MVRYVCERCKKIFYKKCDYDGHINRTNICDINDKDAELKDEIYKCKCDKRYSRKDALMRHIKMSHDGNNEYDCSENNLVKTKNEVNIINNNKGNINNNTTNAKTITIDNSVNNVKIIHLDKESKYDGLRRFGEDGIDSLELDEKIKIFTGHYDPSTALILALNLNSDRPIHHNVGIMSDKTGYGIIYDGNTFISMKIDAIMDAILNSKERDLMDIYDEIKFALTVDETKEIGSLLQECKMIKMDPFKRKLFIKCVKGYFITYKHLAKEAKSVINKRRKPKSVDIFADNTYRKQIQIDDEAKKKIEIGKLNTGILTLTMRIYKECNKITDEEIDEITKIMKEIVSLDDLKCLLSITTAKIFNPHVLTREYILEKLSTRDS